MEFRTPACCTIWQAGRSGIPARGFNELRRTRGAWSLTGTGEKRNRAQKRQMGNPGCSGAPTGGPPSELGWVITNDLIKELREGNMPTDDACCSGQWGTSLDHTPF